MHEFVSIDGEIIRPAEANLAAVTRATLYGAGVFTTLAIYNGKPFLWDKHWRRLDSNSTVIGVDLSATTKAEVGRALRSLIARNRVKDGRARITFFDTAASELWPYDNDRRSAILVTTADRRTDRTPIRLTTSPYRVNSSSPLRDIKSCNYLERLMARNEANVREFHDCVQLNERGEIASASMANIFWVKKGTLFTPSLETGCLAGTTREFIEENLDCKKVTVGIDDLKSADAIFLTSAGYGVVEVGEFEGRRQRRSKHPITNIIPARAGEI